LFRGHGRAWKLRLPWGWNTGEAGPKEVEGDWVASWPPAADLHRADVEEICRKYLNLRYQLLPYLYSSVAQSHKTGLPLIRALCITWPQDATAAITDDAYMWGDHILVAPVYENAAAARSVYLPAGAWWDFWTGKRLDGGKAVSKQVDLATMPLYVRAGAVVPLGPARQYVDEPATEPITLRIYPGADGRFTWYDDDGTSYQYERGEFMRAECEWNDSARKLTITPDPAGSMPLPATIRVELADAKQNKLVKLNRRGITLQL
jgi:alpha-glucosidase/alpha-D-xyloside xylohydrolase